MAKKFYQGREKWKDQYYQNSKSKPYSRLPKDIFQEDLNRFVFGNFHYYYGYRNQDSPDTRLMCMKEEWLTGKDVLDVGCNAGHFTLAVARDFSPRIIVGIDIDNYLVRTAKKNTVYYLNENFEYDSPYPLACISKYGPFAEAVIPGKEDCEVKFPYNITFLQGNYVLDSDELLEMQTPEFDSILCLSVTKWIHLNWGDEGLKRTFHRMYAHLRPGGFLILEPQPFPSYRKKKKISPAVYENFLNIKLYPEQFNEYLLKEVGFESCELVDTPAHSSKGFCRPIYLFKKADEVTENLEEKSCVPKHIFFHYDSSDPSDLSDLEELSD